MKSVIIRILKWVKNTEVLHEILLTILKILVKKTDSPIDDLIVQEMERKLKDKGHET